MKIMIASDIHGSAFYCEKMIEAYRREKADKLLLLGDILYHGPRNDLPKEYNPKKVIQMLNDIKEDILCVRGNCDTEVDQMVLEFPVLAEYCILYVKDRMIFATHGHTFNAESGRYFVKRTFSCASISNRWQYYLYEPGLCIYPKRGFGA